MPITVGYGEIKTMKLYFYVLCYVYIPLMCCYLYILSILIKVSNMFCF